MYINVPLGVRLTRETKIIMLRTSRVNTLRMPHERRTARLTILIDPEKKAVFEDLCAREDLTPSQVVRKLIRGYIEEKLGRPWKPGENPPAEPGSRPRARPSARAMR